MCHDHASDLPQGDSYGRIPPKSCAYQIIGEESKLRVLEELSHFLKYALGHTYEVVMYHNSAVVFHVVQGVLMLNMAFL